MTRTVAHTGSLHVDAAPGHAFQLFTAPGEKLWVDGWDPEVLSGGDGRARGAVFVTRVGGEPTYWVVVDYDTEALHARYARVAPGSRAGTVEVTVRAAAGGGSEVEVTYELTALTAAGSDEFAAFDAQAYAGMLAEWQRMIRDANLEFPLPFADDRATLGAVSQGR
jgi:hypothetical protein